ncbi:MAG: sulfatase-like hydrolase/transferase [Chlamydiia bacterium]
MSKSRMEQKEEDHIERVLGPVFLPINYLFFYFSLLVLVSVHTLHVFLVEPGFTFSRYFFLMYAIAQCILEVALAVSIYTWIQSYLSIRVKKFFIAFFYVFLLSQIIDFFLERLIDISIWYGIGFVLQESFANFIEMLKATSVPISTWLLSAGALLLFLFLGMQLYKALYYFSKKKPVYFSRRMALSLSFGLFVFLVVWDVIFSPFVHENASRQYLKALPWKTTFLPPKHEILLVDGYLKAPWKDRDCFADLDSRAFSLQRKPDIFLIITESLREDFITEQVAPNLSQFRSESIHFPLALSNANATHISWFSFFYSLFPFHFPHYQADQWSKGSFPLQLFKKMGYEIHLHSGSRLGFYKMDEMIFGKDGYLLNSAHSYATEENLCAADADAKAIDGLCQDIKSSDRSGGRLFIVFLDSTHFGYSWPKEMPLAFTPIDDKINFLEAAISEKNLDKIKNRYRNSIHYIDSLFGKFMNTLKANPSWQDSVIVFTGDHGEEFYEHGHLFHASDLSRPQLNVPLYYKMGSGEVNSAVAAQQMSCHMDVFPSIFHYLIGENLFQDVFQGHSIFSKQEEPYVIGARYNAGRSPYEFYIHNGSQKLIAQFDNKEDVFHSRALRIIATKNLEEENIPYSFSIIHQYFGDALNTLFAP